MTASKSSIAGWILSGLVASFLVLASASGKFVDWEGKEAMFAHLGWSIEVMKVVGIVEVAVAIFFLVPRTAFYGAILLTGYLGGATATHARIGEPFFMPMVLGALIWLAVALRDPLVFRAALGRKHPSSHTRSYHEAEYKSDPVARV